MKSKRLDWDDILCHFTSFESAIRIIASNTLLFGDFRNMNDIAEVKRDILSSYPDEFEKEVAKYKCISLTYSSDSKKAFEIDSQWGHYAQKGNGVCLMFDRKAIIREYKEQYASIPVPENLKINYTTEFTNAVFPNTNYDGKRSLNKEEIANIFYTKSKEWENENELRLLVRGITEKDFLKLGKALIAIVVCYPKEENPKNIADYMALRKVLPVDTPILHYTTRLGNKELQDEEGKKLWPIMGKDNNLDGAAIKEVACTNARAQDSK